MTKPPTTAQARQYFTAGRWADAARTARAATQREPASADECATIYGMSMLRLGKMAEARAALEYALKSNPTSTTLRLGLAEAILATGDDVASEQVLDALPVETLGAEEVRAAIRRARRELPTSDVLGLLTSTQRMTPGQWEAGVLLLLELGRPDDATRLLGRQPAGTSPSTAYLLAARTATARLDAPVAVEAWRKAVAKDQSLKTEAFEAMLELDAYDEAASIAQEMLASTGSPLLLGRLALYSGRLPEAFEFLNAAKPTPMRGVAHTALTLLGGNVEEARDMMAWVTRGPSAELLYIETLRRAGQVAEATKAFLALTPRARAQVAAAPLCQIAVHDWKTRPEEAEQVELLRELRGDFPQLAEIEDPVAFAHAAIDSLSGNWGERATRAAGSRTLRQPVSKPLRDRVAALHGSLRGLPLPVVIEEYEALEARHGAHPLIATYGAELLLWWGDYERAELWLNRALALAPRTRWAYVGMATLQNVTGRPEAALETVAKQRALLEPLPNTLTCTAEAHLRLGNLERAQADYRAALAAHPARMSCWLGLAAVLHRLGEDDEEALARVKKLTPVFYRQWQREVADLTPEERFWHGLAMLQGNRASSMITWRTRDGRFHGDNVST